MSAAAFRPPFAQLSSELGYLPLVVLAGYVAMLLGLGFWGYLKSRLSEEDYYLAGRSQGILVTTLTIMATFFSSGAMLGVPGQVYTHGVLFVLFSLNLPLAGVMIYLLGSRIARIGRARGYVTPADLIADYYGGSRLVRILVALVGFCYVVPYVIMQIRAGGHLAQQVFPQVTLGGATFDTFDLGAILLSLVMTAYVLVGGMRSVALADVVQGSLLLTGMLVGGFVAVAALGGVGGYWQAVSALPPDALSLPGAEGRWSAWALLTLCTFGALASMVQPAQWMRFYAARSTQTLRRSAMIFALVLPLCYFFGVMLVGLGARALYPPEWKYPAETAAADEAQPWQEGEWIVDRGARVRGKLVEGVPVKARLVPHPQVKESDQALIAVLRSKGPKTLGALGPLVVAMILMAILAASMSTADSNLHALSAVVTRDVYDRFVRPTAGERERAWVGRGVIVAATIVSLVLVHVGQREQGFAPLRLILEMQIVAMAFSSQLLPVTFDILFLRRGSSRGAACGMIAGILTVLLFTPVPQMLLSGPAGAAVHDAAAYWKSLFDVGFIGLLANVPVFILVSIFTRKPDPQRVAETAEILRG